MAADDVSVLVVDDQAPFRIAVGAVLRRACGFALVGEATDGEEAVEAASRLRPGLVLMDINMPGMSGIEAARRIVDARPGTVVFLCSTYQQADLPLEAAGSGAAAYIDKEQFGPELLLRLWERCTVPAVDAQRTPGS